jgi:hypothetical protein
MTVYDWPRPGRQGRHDDQRARRAYNAGRGTFAGGAIAEPTADVGVRAAPSAAADLWAPIGPSVVIGSDETGSPRVTGRVSGSSLYQVAIEVTPLAKARWKALRESCAGAIDSVVELLQGPRCLESLPRHRLPAGRFHDDPKDDEGLGRHR